MAIAPLIGSFLLNTGLSIGFSLVSSWLSPKKEKQTTEDVPGLGVGQPLYSVWGTSFCPTQLLYAVPASIASSGGDKSTYCMLSLANPDSSCELIALRVNNIICSTKSNQFRLNAPPETIKPDAVYTAPGGYRTYNDFNYQTQLFTPVANPDFGLLGFYGLAYKGLSWIRVDKSSRKLFGGFNSRIVGYYTNRAAGGSISESFDASVNAPVTVRVTVESFGRPLDRERTFRNGLHGSQVFRAFDDVAGSQAGGYYSLLAIEGGRESVWFDHVPQYNNVDYTLEGVTPTRPGAVPLSPGFFWANRAPLLSSGLGSASSIVVADNNGVLTSIPLSTSFNAPFKGNSTTGQIFDGNNVQVATIPIGYVLYGWDNKIFYNSGDNYTPLDNSNLTPASSPAQGTYTTTPANLSTILTDLIVSKGYLTSDVVFDANWTEKLVRGYTDTTENVKDKIINLCTAYGKLVTDTFDGKFTFSDYPVGTSVKTYTLLDMLSEPEFVYTAEVEQPDAVEFSFRKWESEFSEKMIRVGYGSSFSNIKSFRINLVLTESEAKIAAWNMLFLTSHTNLSARLQVDDIATIYPGCVITYVPNTGESFQLLVANIEIGADRTYLLNCVNFIPLNGLNATSFNTYMTGVSDTPLAAIPPTTVTGTYGTIVAAEPTLPDVDPFAGTLFHTGQTSAYNTYQGAGNLLPSFSRLPVSPLFSGTLNSVSSSFGRNSLGGVKIVVLQSSDNTSPPLSSGRLRVGQTWVSYSSYVQNLSVFEFTVTEYAEFASEDDLVLGEPVYQLSPSNIVQPHRQTLAVFSPAYVSQGLETYNLYGVTPSLINPTGTLIGQPTLRFPFGFPAGGLVTAKVATTYFEGVLKVWFSVPGNTQAFPFDDGSSTQTLLQKQFYVQPSVGAPINLGNNLSGYQEFLVTLPAGDYTIYNQTVSSTNTPVGSYVMKGVAY